MSHCECIMSTCNHRNNKHTHTHTVAIVTVLLYTMYILKYFDLCQSLSGCGIIIINNLCHTHSKY